MFSHESYLYLKMLVLYKAFSQFEFLLNVFELRNDVGSNRERISNFVLASAVFDSWIKDVGQFFRELPL